MSRITYSGNQPGWLTATANLLMDRGAEEAPLSIADLMRRVPDQVGGTARNDGHVTAAENGHSRDDYMAGYRIWITGIVDAFTKAGLAAQNETGVRWIGDTDETHRIRFAGRDYPVHGKPQRQADRDRYMLGDPAGNWKAAGLGADGRVLRADTPPLKVNVRTRSKGQEHINERHLEMHPLALAIPPMTPTEQQALRDDIVKQGVLTPIVTFGKRKEGSYAVRFVLDGRHRAYFASVTGRPVELVEFQGTEEEARAHVWSLNAMRRHLTTAQRNLLAIEMFETEAEKEANKAAEEGRLKGNQSRAVVGQSANNGRGRKPAESTNKRIADKAGAGTSERSVQRMRAAGIHADAREKLPDTVEAIDTGKATSAAAAARDASIERGRPKPVLLPEETITEAVGHVRSKVGALLNVLDLNGLPGKRAPGENIAVLQEARRGIDSAITELERRTT